MICLEQKLFAVYSILFQEGQRGLNLDSPVTNDALDMASQYQNYTPRPSL